LKQKSSGKSSTIISKRRSAFFSLQSGNNLVVFNVAPKIKVFAKMLKLLLQSSFRNNRKPICSCFALPRACAAQKYRIPPFEALGPFAA
jgi:hypothetical protein